MNMFKILDKNGVVIEVGQDVLICKDGIAEGKVHRILYEAPCSDVRTMGCYISINLGGELRDIPSYLLEVVEEVEEDNIESLGDITGNAKMISPEQCLRECTNKDIGKKGVFKNAKKLIIIALDDTEEGNYNIGFKQAGMSYSEIVGLLSIAKQDFISKMGF